MKMRGNEIKRLRDPPYRKSQLSRLVTALECQQFDDTTRFLQWDCIGVIYAVNYSQCR
jgi:hypothetical protein